MRSLLDADFSTMEAMQLVRAAKQERSSFVRDKGKSEIQIGILLILLPGGLLTFLMLSGFRFAWALMVLGSLTAYGVISLARGAHHFLNCDSYRGSVTELNDGE